MDRNREVTQQKYRQKRYNKVAQMCCEREREGGYRGIKTSLTYDGQVGHAWNALGLSLDLADIVQGRVFDLQHVPVALG